MLKMDLRLAWTFGGHPTLTEGRKAMDSRPAARASVTWPLRAGRANPRFGQGQRPRGRGDGLIRRVLRRELGAPNPGLGTVFDCCCCMRAGGSAAMDPGE